MACCGKSKNNKLQKQGNTVGSQGAKWNGKVCPKCGWVMNRVHKYNQAIREMTKQWICPNKAVQTGRPCNHREDV